MQHSLELSPFQILVTISYACMVVRSYSAVGVRSYRNSHTQPLTSDPGNGRTLFPITSRSLPIQVLINMASRVSDYNVCKQCAMQAMSNYIVFSGIESEWQGLKI